MGLFILFTIVLAALAYISILIAAPATEQLATEHMDENSNEVFLEENAPQEVSLSNH